MYYRRALKFSIDVLVWVLALPLAYLLRLEFDTTIFAADILKLTLATIPIKAGLILLNRQHLVSWRYSGFGDAWSVITSVIQFTALLCAFKVVFPGVVFIPWSVPVIEAAISLLLFLVIRVSAHIVLRGPSHEEGSRLMVRPSRTVLIAGAGEAGTMILREMLRHPQTGMDPVGFIDDAPQKQAQLINGIPVLGTVNDLPDIFRENLIDEVVIAMPSAPGETVRSIVEHAHKAKVQYRIIPSLHGLISRKVSINQLRDVRIEDLLGRKPVELDPCPIAEYITGKRILVTGAGGSIGSEIVRQLSAFHPALIVLAGRGENSLHQLVLQMERDFPSIPIDVRICDVRDKATLSTVFRSSKPEVVFHASAHKHVKMMELNPAQAIFNNVMGTRNVVELALEWDVRHFVNISTDKAINPTSVMGASKRITEMIVKDASRRAADGRHFVSVRFGNVLGSRGSVVPIFQEQIRKGGPVTITHPDVIRYFMTIPEASQLVLQAGSMQMNGAVFVLKMGKPVRILDMAHDLIRLSGLEPNKDIHIVFTGLVPGEKMFEELLYDDENSRITPHEKIMISLQEDPPDNFAQQLADLTSAAHTGDTDTIKRHIFDLVPSYQGCRKENSTVKSAVS